LGKGADQGGVVQTLDFASYWKEIAVVLAALFAIASTIFEVKDKASHRITIWGRIFFGLTILSMIAGFYAQWEQNAREALRTKQSQNDMLKIIENTNRNVFDLSRILQPLGVSQITLVFEPNCPEVEEFCDAATERGKKEADLSHAYSFSIPDIDWSKLTNRERSEAIFLNFFKGESAARNYLEGDCLGCIPSQADISFEVPFFVGETIPLPSVVAMYQSDSKQLIILDHAKDVGPAVNGDKILSLVDLPRSKLIVWASRGLFKKLVLKSLRIQTDRGQTINIDNLTMVNVKGDTFFEYVFPEAEMR
jgi:hypothetical protein